MNVQSLLLFSLFLAFNLSALKVFAASKKLLSPEDACEVFFSSAVPINRLGLSTHTENHLKAANITRIGDLAAMTEGELLAISGIEESSLAEIKHQFSGVKLLISYEEIQGLVNQPNRTEEPQDKSKDTPPQTSDNSSDFLNRFQTRTRNVLRDLKIIRSLEELAAVTEEELLRIPGLGKKSIKDIKAVLAEEGLHLRSFEELAKLTEEELLNVPRLGNESIEDIKAVLASKGLHLGMESADESSEAAGESRTAKDRRQRRLPRNSTRRGQGIDSLNLSDEINHKLETEKITKVGNLTEMTEEELLIIFSDSELVEVKNALAEAGFYLDMKNGEQQETGKKPNTVDDNVVPKKNMAEDAHHQAKAESEQKTVPLSFIFVVPVSYFQFQNVNSHAMIDSLLFALGSNKIEDIGDLVTKTREQILEIPGVGPARLSEIEFLLEGKNLSLGMKIEGWPLSQDHLEKMRAQLGVAIEDSKNRYNDVFEIARDLSVSNFEMCRKAGDCSIRASGAL